MQDQAESLRNIVGSLSKAKVIAITSGKGGVGKTNLVVNLAIALAKQKKNVVVFDADLGLANVDVLLNITPRYTLYHVLEGHKQLKDVIVEGPAGIRIVPGASGIAKVANLEQKERAKILQDISFLQRDADFIIIDTSAGISKNVLNFVVSSDMAIIVTTPEPTSITDAYAMAKVISQRNRDFDVRIVINMAETRKEAEDVFTRIHSVCKQFLNMDIGLLGYILKDDDLVQSVLERKPVALSYPYSPASKSIAKMAKEIAQDKKGGGPKGQGWFHRILSVMER